MSSRHLLRTVILAGVGLVGCGGADGRPPAWSYISPAIVQSNCATSSCHNSVVAVAGLDLSTADVGWKGLMAQKLPDVGAMKRATATTPQIRPLVTPFNPTESRVVNMLRANGANRMPPDRPLAEADIALIEQWILEGAKND